MVSTRRPPSSQSAKPEDATTVAAEATTPVEAPRPGRKRDPSRDGDIMDAALEVLAEEGYAGMTMDLVAQRASAGKATMYRRWASKAELVLDAVARMKATMVDLDRLPDTGTLRGDLLGLFKPSSIEEGERKLKIMAGLSSMLSAHEGFSEAASAAMVDPWAAAHRKMMLRAQARGEISAEANIETACRVIPSMAAYRSLILRKPFEFEFLRGLVDDIIIPALVHAKPLPSPLSFPAGASPSGTPHPS